ncbi:hypothetical protein GALMADRAFT_254618 [Galerina marginata CBS 339.88]|uniref:C2H2-type domain-containing protein n=1 Tax=Galerina marginata (strain CBS 339.88) TaxID=685588 RepID=A0A067SHX5_GALM3|nr:hypothetical protein GALMADRAFT_254618 [Galerina marginata CBS 339.88]
MQRQQHTSKSNTYVPFPTPRTSTSYTFVNHNAPSLSLSDYSSFTYDTSSNNRVSYGEPSPPRVFHSPSISVHGPYPTQLTGGTANHTRSPSDESSASSTSNSTTKLRCQWSGCRSFVSNNPESLAHHFGDSHQIRAESSTKKIRCLWRNCGKVQHGGLEKLVGHIRRAHILEYDMFCPHCDVTVAKMEYQAHLTRHHGDLDKS